MTGSGSAGALSPGGVSGTGVRLRARGGLPRLFGRYTLLCELASGGMAELFLAIQRGIAGFEKLVVVKRILPSLARDRSFIDMLLHEARITATLSHPNIVHVFDVGQVDGSPFIAMEHVPGADVRSLVHQMKRKGVPEFPLEHAVSIVRGMCAGLAYAHEKVDLDGTPLNIVHRDISPQNVVVTFTGDVKVVDFGIAKSDLRLHENTRSGTLKGKASYMSPEQARGESVDGRSDIFATGVMLFELTTGKLLFKGVSEYETLTLICERDYPLPSMVRAGYPPALEAIVMRALARDKAHRFQSAREMQTALEEFARDERLATSDISLSAFMQMLFEEQIPTWRAAILEGRRLAEVLAREDREDEDESGGIDRRAPTTSTLSAADPIRTAWARRGAKGKIGLMMALAAVGLVLGVWAWTGAFS